MPARKSDFDSKLIGEIAGIMADTGLTEVELRQGDSTLRLSKTAGAAAAAPVAAAPVHVAAPGPAAPAPGVAAPAASEPAPPAVEAEAEHPGTVSSPMVGTVYLAPQPDADPFVKAGDKIGEGDTLMIIEAMKVMNPIPSPRAGTVKAILVSDAQPVEFGDPLIIIE
ncbi:MAG: acetyl-CoA carboxylase biotin carboxyl carrier protein [Rhodospirillales bacterium]|nr:MAG: acetyl-CoA carboxylase biotin carboxyl carrier protein [Rhodospirillales bacterium]